MTAPQLRRTPSKYRRPACAGWWQDDHVCNGSRKLDRLPCAYREHCLELVAVCGGVDRRTAEKMHEVLDSTDDMELWQRIEREDGEDLPLYEPDAGERPKSHRKPITAPPELPTIYPRPVENFGRALKVVDAVVERFARELGKVVVAEDDPNRHLGDLYLRYEGTRGGRTCRLYETIRTRRKYHRLIAKFQMNKGRRGGGPIVVNVMGTIDDYDKAYALRPPSALQCRGWKDNRKYVVIVGVSSSTAAATGRWLARCYQAGIIQGKR